MAAYLTDSIEKWKIGNSNSTSTHIHNFATLSIVVSKNWKDYVYISCYTQHHMWHRKHGYDVSNHEHRFSNPTIGVPLYPGNSTAFSGNSTAFSQVPAPLSQVPAPFLRCWDTRYQVLGFLIKLPKFGALNLIGVESHWNILCWCHSLESSHLKFRFSLQVWKQVRAVPLCALAESW